MTVYENKSKIHSIKSRIEKLKDKPLIRSLFAIGLDDTTTALGVTLGPGISGELNLDARRLMEKHGSLKGILEYEKIFWSKVLALFSLLYVFEKKFSDKIKRPSLSIIKEMMKNNYISNSFLDGISFYKYLVAAMNVSSLMYNYTPQPWKEVASVAGIAPFIGAYLYSFTKYHSKMWDEIGLRNELHKGLEKYGLVTR